MPAWLKTKAGTNIPSRKNENDMKLNRIFVLLPVACALWSCGFDDEPIQFDYTSVYFVNQAYNRNVIVGEGLAFKPGVQFAGVIKNNAERLVKYTVDASLVPAGKTALPEDYYTMEGNNSTIVIPKGQMKGYVQFRLDSTKFVGDPRSLTGEFVLPLRLTDLSGIDRITENKGTMLLSLSYFAKQQANYTYSGSSDKTVIATGATTTVNYANNPTLTASFRLLHTVGPDLLRMEGDKAANTEPVLGATTFYVKVPVYGGGDVTIMADPVCPVAVEPNGTSTYDEATRTFTLRYKYTRDGADYTAVDVMVFRNRIRDKQSETEYINEWRF